MFTSITPNDVKAIAGFCLAAAIVAFTAFSVGQVFGPQLGTLPH
jgi:hypothetical protein